MKTVKFFFIIGVLFILVLSGCSEVENEIPTQTAVEDPLTNLLQDASADVREKILKDIPEDLRMEISMEISEEHHRLSKRGRLFIALIQAVSPPPFFDPNGKCAPLLTIDPIQGEGIGTLVGRHTVVQSHCFNPETFEFTNGFVTLTTASGNHQLFEEYYGTLTPTKNPDILTIRGNTNFVGGTGRFNGASGAGFAIGTLNIANGESLLLNISTLDTQPFVSGTVSGVVAVIFDNEGNLSAFQVRDAVVNGSVKGTSDADLAIIKIDSKGTIHFEGGHIFYDEAGNVMFKTSDKGTATADGQVENHLTIIEGAAGKLTTRGTVNFQTGELSLTYEGTIRY